MVMLDNLIKKYLNLPCKLSLTYYINGLYK